MGNTTTQTKNQQQAEATPLEQQLNQNLSNVANANVGNQESINNNSAALINSILTGNYSGAGAGITPAQNQSIVNQSLRDIAPQFQTSGILNSGEAGQVATQTAALTANANAQFNVQADQNLKGIGLGEANSFTSTNNKSNQVIGNQLAGLRNVQSNGTVTSNPFLNSFYSTLGQQAGQTVGNIGNSFIGTGSSSGGGGGFSNTSPFGGTPSASQLGQSGWTLAAA